MTLVDSPPVASVYSSAPATAIGSLAVASIESLIIPAMPVVIGGKPYLYTTESLTVDTTPYPIYVSSLDIADPSNLACSPFGPEVDLQGKVTIVVRGSCSFAAKAQNVLDAGGDIMLSSSSLTLVTSCRLPLTDLPARLSPQQRPWHALGLAR